MWTQKLKKVPSGNFSLKMATHVEVNGNTLREWIRLHCKMCKIKLMSSPGLSLAQGQWSQHWSKQSCWLEKIQGVFNKHHVLFKPPQCTIIELKASWFYKFIASEPDTAVPSTQDATQDDLDPVGHLDDSNLVGNVKSVVVWRQAHISLLVPSGSHQCVHLVRWNFICWLLVQ